MGAGSDFRGQVLRPDGSESFEIEQEGPPSEAARIGAEAGRTLAARLPPGVLPRGG